MKWFALSLFIVSISASAANWKHHECTVTLDQKTFRMNVYSSWSRCEGTASGKRYSAIIQTALDGYASVKGDETYMYNHRFYHFKNFSAQYPGTFTFMLQSGHDTDSDYEGFGEYIPQGRGNVLSFKMNCNLGSDLACED